MNQQKCATEGILRMPRLGTAFHGLNAQYEKTDFRSPCTGTTSCTNMTASTSRSPQHRPESEKPLKLACATCIQGHRASTCKHQDGSKGPLLVVKRRGRPLSQCQECRERRLRTGRHTRCDCKNKTKRCSDASAEPPAKRQATHTSPSRVTETPSFGCGPLSFEFLLNPCNCESGKVCICCKYPFACPQTTTSRSESIQLPPIAPKASNGEHEIHKSLVEVTPSHCCIPLSTKTPVDYDRSMKLLARAADMSRSYKPECQCIGLCRCIGCAAHPLNVNSSADLNESSCMTCVSCDLSLERPSGIDHVDRWARIRPSL